MALPEPPPPAPRLVELASGVDALYLSGRAQLSSALFGTLAELKAAAQEADAAVPLVLAGTEFGVEPRAFGKYRYCLVHPHGMVGVTESERLPTFRVQPRAEFIHAVGAAASLRFFNQIGEYLAGGPVAWGLSRLDLFCDVQGWQLVGDDRHRFLCRAEARVTHERSGEFTGFEFGRRSTRTVCARIYDKTVQVEQKGLDWWPTIWGDRFDKDRPVLRVEFEIGRQGLKEYGIDTPTEGLEAVGRLWASVSSDWLTYRVPTSDLTKSRWPVASEWTAVQAASLRADAIGLDRVRAGRNAGELRRILPGLVGYLATAGAILDHNDLPTTLGAIRYLVSVDERRRGVAFRERIADRKAARAYQ